MTKNTCYKCREYDSNQLENLFGYTICASCIKDLGLLKDNTIQRHLTNFNPENYKRFNSQTYRQEIENRIEFLEEDFINKKIKLLHVLDRLEHL